MSGSTMGVRLVSLSQGIDGMSPEELIAYCGRVSNPNNQENHDTAPKLLKFLIKHQHWSPFEMATMCVEIKTNRGIAAQILRHRSFSFQEFSQRYSPASMPQQIDLRLKAEGGNRQGSSPLFAPGFVQQQYMESVKSSFEVYEWLLNNGVAPESARFVLPLCAATVIYMSGTVRSWIHYLDIRDQPNVQKEHQEIANKIKTEIFIPNFPSVATALEWI